MIVRITACFYAIDHNPMDKILCICAFYARRYDLFDGSCKTPVSLSGASGSLFNCCHNDLICGRVAPPDCY